MCYARVRGYVIEARVALADLVLALPLTSGHVQQDLQVAILKMLHALRHSRRHDALTLPNPSHHSSLFPRTFRR